MTHIIRHAFLTPGHNCWSVWTSGGCRSLTNEGPTHRVLESLAFVIDQMSNEGWHVQQIFLEQGAPSFVLLSREDMVD